MYRQSEVEPEFFLVHPGGPFWKNKDEGAWSIPKGIVERGEPLLSAAIREFHEETGITPKAPFQELGSLKTKGGKLIYAWAFKGEWKSENGIVSNRIKIEFPYRSGRFIEIPEADKASWLNYGQASKLINASQQPFLERCRLLLQQSR